MDLLRSTRLLSVSQAPRPMSKMGDLLTDDVPQSKYEESESWATSCRTSRMSQITWEQPGWIALTQNA